MARKILAQCPDCGRFLEVKKGFFGYSDNVCVCGKVIDMKNSTKSVVCASCGNVVVFNANSKTEPLCPVCKNPVDTLESKLNKVELTCEGCNTIFMALKTQKTAACPMCDRIADVEKFLRRSADMKEAGPNIIRFGGSADDLLWKHPMNMFGYKSQLVVSEGEAALFFRNGKVEKPLGAGSYLLERDNLTMSEKFSSDSDVTFASEVVFINLSTFDSLHWGTTERISLIDPVHKIHISLGAYGTYSVRVNAPLAFYRRLGMGKERITVTDMFGDETRGGLFRTVVANIVRTAIAKSLTDNNIGVLHINEFIENIARDVGDKVNADLQDYGIAVPNFRINAIKPEETAELAKVRKMQSEGMFVDYDNAMRNKKMMSDFEYEHLRMSGTSDLEILKAQKEVEKSRLLASFEADKIKMMAEADAQARLMRAQAERQEEENRRIGRLDDMSHKEKLAQLHVEEVAAQAGAISSLKAPGIFSIGASQQPAPAPSAAPGFIELGPKTDEIPCANCKRPISAAFEFCPFCGRRKSAAKKCPQCGSEVPLNGKFCASCGSALPN